MLIDASHSKWIALTAGAAVLGLGVYLWADLTTPGGLTGGSALGLWYALLGSAMMIFAGLLSALRRVASWWFIGSRQWWLKGHIWLGLLSAVFILCHSGFRWGGPLEQMLWVVFALTIITGVAGLLLQQFVPRLLTGRVNREAPYEQIPHLCEVMLRKADGLADRIWATAVDASGALIMGSQFGIGAKLQFQKFYEQHVRPFISEGTEGSAILGNPLQAAGVFAQLRALPGLQEFQGPLEQLETICDERRQMAEQEKWHLWLHCWLMLHVPLSVLLLLLGLAHAAVTLYY